jgi:hypothetical protein
MQKCVSCLLGETGALIMGVQEPLASKGTQDFVIELVIVTNLLTSFKYGSLFKDRTNLSKNDNIMIGFQMNLGQVQN